MARDSGAAGRCWASKSVLDGETLATWRPLMGESVRARWRETLERRAAAGRTGKRPISSLIKWVRALGCLQPASLSPCGSAVSRAPSERKAMNGSIHEGCSMGSRAKISEKALEMLGLSRVSMCTSGGVDSGGVVASLARASALEFFARWIWVSLYEVKFCRRAPARLL
ncbi:hypothetical protein ACLB2K_020706 [Fragaria x ananassa]